MRTPTAQVFCDAILDFTIQQGDITSLCFLIDCGISGSAICGIRGARCLQIALVYDKMDIAEYLLDNGVEVNPPLSDYPYDKPPLHTAVNGGHLDIVRCLINAGANIDRKCSLGSTALVHGLRSRNKPIDCIRLLLDAGADVDNERIYEFSVLDWVYFHWRYFYRMILSRSQHAKRSLTTSGILYAASAGSQALRQYVESITPSEERERKNELELALCLAVYHDEPIGVVPVLLDFGVDPNVSTMQGLKRPLIVAAMRNDKTLAEYLLDAGADVNTPGFLAMAAHGGNRKYALLNFLIERGADIKTFGADALRETSLEGNLAIVKLLLSLNVDINDPGGPVYGRTLLQRAVSGGDLNVIKYLIRRGAAINAPPCPIRGLTALQAAALEGNMELVKLLIHLKADVNLAPSRDQGRTALEASVDCDTPSERADLFQFLLDHGAPINRPKSYRGYRNWSSVLTILVRRSADETLIRSAINAGADINELGHGNGARTPLQAAAEIGSITTVQLLLDNKADINAPPGGEYGKTALQAACLFEVPNIKLVQLLLDHKADVNAPASFKQGVTALQAAAIRGHVKIALMLVDAGAEVNTEPAVIDGRTALDGAAEHGRLDMVQLLLNLRAESEEPGQTGFDWAIELAEEHNHWAVADLLKSQARKT